MLNLEHPATFVQSFTDTLRFSVSPDDPSTRRSSEQGAVPWVSRQIRGNLVAHEWANPPLVGNVGKALRRIARPTRPHPCLLSSLNFGAPSAPEWSWKSGPSFPKGK